MVSKIFFPRSHCFTVLVGLLLPWTHEELDLGIREECLSGVVCELLSVNY